MTTPPPASRYRGPTQVKRPRVSVVIPTFDSARFVVETVRSVLDQTYPDLEVVISDHSSSDGTWDLLQVFTDDPRVRLMRVAAGGGAPANWAAVTATATGDLLKLVCADDLLYPTAIAEQVAAFAEHPGAVLVAARRDIVDADGRVLVRDRGLQGLSGLVDGPDAVRRAVAAGTNVFGEPVCVLVRRSALAAAGGWDARSPYLIDEATFAAVLRRGPMVALDRTLAAFRVSDQQWSVGLARRQAADARRFHRTVQRERPGVLRRSDRVVGNARATALAYARRAAYLGLRLRSARVRATTGDSVAYPDRDRPLGRIAG